MNREYSDEHLLTTKMHQGMLVARALPHNVLLVGAFSTVNKFVPAVMPESAALLHFNWMVGANKIKAMKVQKMWYLP